MGRIDREGPIHRSVIEYLRKTLPGAVIHHSANERRFRGKHAARDIASAKRNGMLVGFPDIICIWRGLTICFEVKAPGNYPTDAQKAVGASIKAQGGYWGVVRGIDDTQGLLSAWLDIRPEQDTWRHIGDVVKDMTRGVIE